MFLFYLFLVELQIKNININIYGQIKNILHLKTSFEKISFTHVFGETNFMVDALTNLDHSIEGFRFWENSFPFNVLPVFNFDQFGVECPRDFCL